MGVIWTPQTRTKQPATIVPLNTASPFHQGLLFSYSGIGGKREDRFGDTIAAFGSGASISPGIAGNALTFTGSQGVRSASWGTAWNRLAGATSLTVELLIQPASLSSGKILAKWDGGVNIYLVSFAGTNAIGFVYGDQLGNRSGRQTPSNSLTNNALVHVVSTWDATAGHVIYINGVSQSLTDFASSGTLSSIGTDTTLSTHQLGSSDSDSPYNGKVFIARIWNRVLPPSQVTALYKNPWQLYLPERKPFVFDVASGANTTGTLNSTLDAATLTGVGAVTRSGTLAVTLDAATLAGIGGVSTSGTLAVTLDAATLTGIGAVTTSGTLSNTLEDATLAGVGSVAVGTNRDGTLAVTLDAATLAGIGAVTRSGTLAVTLDNATLVGIGTAGQAVTGTLAVTLDNATLSGVGAIPAAPSQGGGTGTGRNLSRKQKKKLKAVESQEWLKAEETARQLLSDRFTKQTPKEKAEALQTYVESLQPVIEALKALTAQIEEVVEEAPIIELTPHQEVIQRFDRLEKKVKSVEELIIILMAAL